MAFFSDSEGTFGLPLTADGAADGDRRRLGESCRGGLAAAGVATGALLACLQPPRPDKDLPGRVLLLELDQALGIRRRSAFGRVGPGSRGVAVARAGGVPVVAFRDGAGGRGRVFVAQVPEGAFAPAGAEDPDHLVEPRLLSRDGVDAGPPALYGDETRWLATWAETVLDAEGDVVGEIMLGDGRGAPRSVAHVLYEDPRPVLTRDALGFVLGFRDTAPSGSRARIFVQRLGARLSPAGEPIVVGRANGPGGPTLLSCPVGLFTIAPRSFDRAEVLVGINHLGPTLEKRVGERQLYQVGKSFGIAGAICAGDGVLVVSAERAAAGSPGAQLLSATVACAAPRGG